MKATSNQASERSVHLSSRTHHEIMFFQLPSPYAILHHLDRELVFSRMQKPGFMFEFNSFDDRNKANPIVGEWPALPPTTLSVSDDIRPCQTLLSMKHSSNSPADCPCPHCIAVGDLEILILGQRTLKHQLKQWRD
jgi:hypothetical protein